MSVKVVGKQMVDFENDKGEKIEGLKLHIVGSDKNVIGQSVFTQFLKVGTEPYEVANGLPVGACVVFVYDRKGKVEEIILANAEKK